MNIYLLGIGANSSVYMDLIEDCGHSIAGLYHYNHTRTGESYSDTKIDGCFEDLLNRSSLKGMNFALSMGDITVRKALYDRILAKGCNVPTLIHPTAIISKRASIGEGVIILPRSIVQADVSIGNNTVITIHTTIAHTSRIGNHCMISGHCIVGAYVHVCDSVQIGQGSTLVSGKVNVVGEHSIVGAGAVLREDVKPHSMYIGNPAIFIKAI